MADANSIGELSQTQIAFDATMSKISTEASALFCHLVGEYAYHAIQKQGPAIHLR